MNITTYTTYEEIRLVLGLSPKELTDRELSSPMYENILSLAMAELVIPSAVGSGTTPQIYATVAALAENARTTNQQKFYDLLRLYSAYSIANEVAVALPLRAPKMIADSKASLTRFSPEATFQDVISKINDRLASLKYQIEHIGSTSVTSLPYSFVVNPAVDVVLGE
jgi:dihydroorotase